MFYKFWKARVIATFSDTIAAYIWNKQTNKQTNDTNTPISFIDRQPFMSFKAPKKKDKTSTK